MPQRVRADRRRRRDLPPFPKELTRRPGEEARDDGEVIRAETPARRRPVGAEELALLLARAEDEAGAVRARAAQRLPGLVERVLAHVRIQLSVLVGDDAVPAPSGPAEAAR